MSNFAESLTIQACLDRYRAGDSVALDELLGHCRERLRLLTRQMLGGFPQVHKDNDTSDVLQEGLLRISKAIVQIQPATALDLFKLAATNLRWALLDLNKKLQDRDDVHLDGAWELLPDQQTPSPQELTVWAEFHDYIACLPDDQRCLFDLLYYQGLSLTAAADLLGQPLSTLRRHWLEAQLNIPSQYIPRLPTV